MLSSCLKCSKNTENKNPKVIKVKSGRIILLSKHLVCYSKKWNLKKSKKLVDY